MYARLAFATAAATDPDILIIDEVLAVGDAAFQKKCYDRFDDYKNQKKTIVFVSHSIGQIEMLCEKTVFLDNGKLISSGKTKDVVADYMTKLYYKEKDNASQQFQKEEKHDRWGNREVEITEVKFFGDDGKDRYVFQTGEMMIVKMKYFAKKKILRPISNKKISAVHEL